MRIIIEGAPRTGKTTLAKQLAAMIRLIDLPHEENALPIHIIEWENHPNLQMPADVKGKITIVVVNK